MGLLHGRSSSDMPTMHPGTWAIDHESWARGQGSALRSGRTSGTRSAVAAPPAAPRSSMRSVSWSRIPALASVLMTAAVLLGANVADPDPDLHLAGLRTDGAGIDVPQLDAFTVSPASDHRDVRPSITPPMPAAPTPITVPVPTTVAPPARRRWLLRSPSRSRPRSGPRPAPSAPRYRYRHPPRRRPLRRRPPRLRRPSRPP